MNFITSTQNQTIKERAKLLKKKTRDQQNLFLVEGKHLLEEAEKANILREVFLCEGQSNPTQTEATFCSQSVLNKLSAQKSDAKMIGVCQKKNFEAKNIQTALFLDEVQDPGNVGTILRTAYSFGVDCVYLSKNCADIYNPKTIQSSKGALFHIPCKVGDLSLAIQKHKKDGMCIYGAALHRESLSLDKIHVQNTYGIVVGNEGQGIHEEILQICNQTVYIEMDQFESLNVSIAAAILLYTFKHK